MLQRLLAGVLSRTCQLPALLQHLLRELGLIDLLAAYMEAARVRVFAAAPKLRHTRLGLWVIESGKQCHRCACPYNTVSCSTRT